MPSLSVTSPDAEVFSTPPSTPGYPITLPPSLSRRNSRPSTLQIDRSHPDWNPDVVLEEQSPDSGNPKAMRQNGHHPNGQSPLVSVNATAITRQSSTPPSATMHSPCFVHSHLDKGASLADWLRIRQQQQNGSNLGVLHASHQNKDEYHSLQHPSKQIFGVQYPENNTSKVVLEVVDDEGDDYAGSFTRQLAETAVGVREMSKQLGMSLSLWTFVTCISSMHRSGPGALKYTECLNRDKG